MRRLFPKSSYLYTSFGKMCAQMSFEDEAERSLSTAIKLKETNSSAVNELALLHQVSTCSSAK